MEQIKHKAIIFFATGGWIGYAPAAPGTFGSLAALPLCWFITRLSVPLAFLLISAVSLISIWISHLAEKIEDEKDPGQVVVDEICGMTIALFAFPFTVANVICGFALFRLFDICKPFPIRWIDGKVSGGLGIVLDDIIAGLFANCLFRLVKLMIS